MSLLRVGLLLGVLCAPLVASAGDLCVGDATNQAIYVFKRVRVPKAPLDAVPVAGYMMNGAATAGIPLSGTLMRQATGQLMFGLTQHGLECVISMSLNAQLTGQVHLDCDLDGDAETSGDVGRIDCGLLQ